MERQAQPRRAPVPLLLSISAELQTSMAPPGLSHFCEFCYVQALPLTSLICALLLRVNEQRSLIRAPLLRVNEQKEPIVYVHPVPAKYPHAKLA